MQRNNKEVQDFYNSSQWEKTRRAYKNYRYGLCERCRDAWEDCTP